MTKPTVTQTELTSELGATPLPEGTYSFDLELGDRYQKFSEEIARLALLGVSAIGFLLVNLKQGGEKGDSVLLRHIDIVQFSLYAALIGFAAAIGCALAHRYFATDSLAIHLEGLRREKRGTTTDLEKASKARSQRDVAFKRSGRLLAWAAVCLGIGVSALAVTFALAMIVYDA